MIVAQVHHYDNGSIHWAVLVYEWNNPTPITMIDCRNKAEAMALTEKLHGKVELPDEYRPQPCSYCQCLALVERNEEGWLACSLCGGV